MSKSIAANQDKPDKWGKPGNLDKLGMPDKPVEQEKLGRLAKLVEKLGIDWRDVSLLETALTHTSYANECKSRAVEHNQRLEFLGDAVLELVISDYLFTLFPQAEEGELTKIRAAVVCEPALAKAAKALHLGHYLRMGKGEEQSGGRERPAAQADTFESVIGAIFRDQGLTVARQFILRNLQASVAEFSKGSHGGDFKSEVQELVQQYTDTPVTYVILEEQGPDHCKTFTAGLQYGDQLWGKGTGHTKKEAEQLAAQDALNMLKSKKNLKKLFK